MHLTHGKSVLNLLTGLFLRRDTAVAVRAEDPGWCTDAVVGILCVHTVAVFTV